MICAEDEIGVGASHDGIIVLPEDAPVGQPAAEYYNLESDWLIEVDITPNRADALSHWGWRATFMHGCEATDMKQVCIVRIVRSSR